MLPLYDGLLREATDNDLTNSEKSTLVKNIKKMDKAGHELVYVFIRLFEEGSSEMPYEMKAVKTELKVDVDKLPNKLKQILLKFSNMHLSKMKEDIRLSVERV